MYTQCPECQIAFRVTAKVLQQAGGNVRCGSCGHAFNALEYLSEEMPDHVGPTGNDTEQPVDDLAETSRRLLQTLDELAGPEEVLIEDTGVEWRVLDKAAAEDVKLAPDQLEPERRYDDNTPLPDEFDDEEEASPPQAPQRREEDHQAGSDEFEERQRDLALSEPGDWADILEEVRDPNVESLEVEEELAAIHNELSAIDEALTDEVPRLDESDLETPDDETPDDVVADLIEQIEAGAVAELAAVDDEEPGDTGDDLEEDEDTGVFESVLAEDDDADEEREIYAEEDEGEGDGEDEDEDEADAFEPDITRESTGEFDAQIEEAALALAADEYGLDNDASEEDDGVDERAADEEDAEDTDDDEADSGIEDVDDDVERLDDAEAKEEKATADEKFDFAATMVGLENAEELFDESSGEVETIIMEGEFVRSEVEQDRLAAGDSARSQLDDPANLLDTYALNRGKKRGGRRSYDPPSMVMIGAIVGLSLILIGQFMHNSRQSLATYGFFNSTIAPVYRMLGNPITPDWDVNGWQFEATNGSVDEEQSILTIVSRIANQSPQLLPYPLVHVELTDRFDEVTGSAILEPAEYLAVNSDPSQPVEPGESFTAVITVDDPSVEVSGYRLKVCYRIEPGTVHCAEEAFKN